jgi:hypothetical protein
MEPVYASYECRDRQAPKETTGDSELSTYTGGTGAGRPGGRGDVREQSSTALPAAPEARDRTEREEASPRGRRITGVMLPEEDSGCPL